MTWNEHLTEDRRLVALRVMSTQEGYAINESVLHAAFVRLGHKVSRDRVRADMVWLSEQELIKLELVAGSIYVATLAQRGLDVAQGNTIHPGVKRPSPGG